MAVPSDLLPPQQYPSTQADTLDYKPALTLAEEALCLLVTAVSCGLLYAATAPPTFRLTYAAGMAAACTALLALARSALLERHFKAVQRSERELAGPGALFRHVGGTEVHYTRERSRCTPSPDDGGRSGSVAVHCLHGFGASAYSWSFVQRDLANALKGVVTAHDMPGFGLSQRPPGHNFYTLAFNGAVAQDILQAETEALPQTTGQPPKRILIGHSMGGAAAAEAVIHNAQGIAGLVLVAPAIVALWMGPPTEAQGDAVATSLALVEEFVAAQDPPDVLDSAASVSSSSSLSRAVSAAGDPLDFPQATEPPSAADSPAPNQLRAAEGERESNRRRKRTVHRALRVVAAVLQAVVAELLRLVVLLLTPALVLLLRRLVRSRAFWERGLASAWFDKSRAASRQYVDAYRFPQLVRGWEGGMLRFLRGRFSEKTGVVAAVAHAVQGDGHLSQAERLAAACRAAGVQVLIVHGVQDALVPVANSRRLAKLLGAKMVEVEGCGHMPQEEVPDMFVAEVAAFAAGL